MIKLIRLVLLLAIVLVLLWVLSACGFFLSSSTHQVQPGESYASIAAHYNLKVDYLMQANPNKPTIKPGDVINIPAPPQPPTSPHMYEVKNGDTLQKIVALYNPPYTEVTVDSIMKANGFTDPNFLRTGQRIIIPINPAPSPVEFTYYVKKGDTFANIAQRCGLSEADLLAINGLPANNTLVANGQGVLIRVAQNTPCANKTVPPLPAQPAPTLDPQVNGRGGAAAQAADKVAAPATPAASNTPAMFEYVVQRGDYLSLIATRFKTTVQQICQDNGISNPNLIWVGQRLKIRQSS